MSDPSQDPNPYYLQVANILRSEIVSSNSDIPVRLPGEESLARTYQAARGTIRQALRVLAEEGLIHRTQGRSTLTIPAGIHAWRQLHKSQVLRVISSWRSLPDLPSSFYGQIYQGILMRGEQRGYQVAPKRMADAYRPSEGQSVPEDPERTVGVITINIFDERTIAMHVNAGYPVVCTDYWPANPLADGIVFDCYGEGQMAAEFLIGLGHRVIFYLGNTHIDNSGQPHQESDADLFEAGCRRTLREAGLSLPPRRVRFLQWSQVDEATRWYLSLRPRPTAGIIFNTDMLRGFRQALARHDLSCPRDVSLMCKAAISDPTQVASLRNDPFPIGQMAVDLLLERAAGMRPPGVRIAKSSHLQHGPTVRSL